MISKICSTTIALMIALATTAQASNFRCPNGSIVSVGDKISIVSAKCDTPTSKSTRVQSDGGTKGATILINFEEWTYNEGSNRLVHVLTFRDGVLESVQTAGYGK